MRSQMRRFVLEGLRVAGQHGCQRTQVKVIIRPAKALQHPTTEEAGTASDKNTLAPYLLPQIAGVVKNVIKIGGQ
ncbi:MAG: hypothetical protein IMZ50_03270 [Candidatus Atribacteria bacterium]|nr:hypothetical protein [Candidatus Atribacteria bacterium]